MERSLQSNQGSFTEIREANRLSNGPRTGSGWVESVGLEDQHIPDHRFYGREWRDFGLFFNPRGLTRNKIASAVLTLLYYLHDKLFLIGKLFYFEFRALFKSISRNAPNSKFNIKCNFEKTTRFRNADQILVFVSPSWKCDKAIWKRFFAFFNSSLAPLGSRHRKMSIIFNREL